ncbi:MAG: tRNA lysidine(34) synthetase TilS [Rhodospirillaceae bacterium]|nr:tRNA lysidine(34) synthetase TilS [Rhodospirillaceae bacterium]
MPKVIENSNNLTTGTSVSSGTFARFMDAFGPFAAGGRIAVAVSGGPDSMALCHLSKEWADFRGLRVVGLTVDHRLRDEGRTESQQVSKWLEAVEMEHETLTWEQGESVKALDRSPQAAARDARFGLLCGWCRENDIVALMTAHHADDQAETFLYRLVRGSGVNGLAAIAPETMRNEVRILRPLLKASKADLISTCGSHGQDWVNDPSNSDDAFARVRLRRIMTALEQEGLHRDRLLKTVDHMARAKSAIDAAVDELMDSSSMRADEGPIEIDVAALNEAPEEIGLRCLARCLMQVSGAVYPPRFDSLTSLYKALDPTKWSDRTLHGCQLRMKSTQLVVSLESRER